ncbi:MAG TPA: hypothetical protein VHL53_19850, partial [Acidimicrobiia bacterium]|nr:hypothetical protein [Acidimicrobiia bacterium]
MMLVRALAALAVVLPPMVPAAAGASAAPAAGGPVPEHTVIVVLRDYMPSNAITIKHGESIRFVDGDPTAGPGHSFTENVPDGVTPKFDSDVVPPGLFKDVANISSLPPGK